MGYYADCSGSIKLKDDTTEELIDSFVHEAEEIFEYIDLCDKEINISSSEKYHFGVVSDFLNKIAPYTKSGDLEYIGEDYTMWRFHYDGHKFVEEVGKVAYPSEEASEKCIKIAPSDEAEFVGEVIDIFEDFLDERGIELENPERNDSDSATGDRANIYGSDYGDLQQAIEEILNRWQTSKENTITGLYIEPGKTPELRTIENTLASLQKTVGGMVEPFRPYADDLVILLNEEGKINGMLPNRAIYGEDGKLLDVIYGPAFLCGTDGVEFCSLREDLRDRYKEMFETSVIHSVKKK